MSECFLDMRNISKEFYGNQVLKGVNLQVNRGEIHALIGENGAGKSTLMNILFGMPEIHSTGGFKGSVVIDGKETEIKSPHEAMEYGIGMVHQEFMLIPGFSITENIKINREITKPNAVSRLCGRRLEMLDRRTMDQDARKALDTLEMPLDEKVLVEGLPVGYMQFIEIAREIDKKGVRLLVFDEPTAVLTEKEALNMMDAVRKLSGFGIAIIFISHRLDEIVSLADRVTVLRDGEWVATKEIKDTSAKEIAELMIGRKVELNRASEEGREVSDETILSIRGLEVAMPGERVKGVDLEIRKGEILGIGGLAGQGKLGIANGLMGIYPSRGEVTFEGKKLALNDPRGSIRSGLGFVSEDRKGIGLLLDESIEMNIAVTAIEINSQFLKKYGPVQLKDAGAIREHANKMIEELDIRCTSPREAAGQLSGGNQQKVCVARALTLNPKLLLVSEPTRGIDIGAKKLILDLLVRLNKEYGMTILITSSELAELRSICDEIAIICDGTVNGILSPFAPEAEFGLMMSGSKHVEGGLA